MKSNVQSYKELTKFLSMLCVLCAFVGKTNAQINYAKQMAATIMNQYKDSMVVKKYASHLEQDKLPEGNRPANWNYEIGVVLMGFERLAKNTGDNTYMDYTKHIIDHFINEDGSIKTYIMEEYNSDMVPPGRQLLHLRLLLLGVGFGVLQLQGQIVQLLGQLLVVCEQLRHLVPQPRQIQILGAQPRHLGPLHLRVRIFELVQLGLQLLRPLLF